MTREEELKELKYREQRKVVKITDNDGWKLYECPTCREDLDELCGFNYCPDCGQKLDWSELDD